MSVSIRLRRLAKKPSKKPYFRIGVFDKKSCRDSNFIEEIGYYKPVSGEVKLNWEKFQSWVKKGGVPTQTVARLVKKLNKGE